jgi:hypothetical protein
MDAIDMIVVPRQPIEVSLGAGGVHRTGRGCLFGPRPPWLPRIKRELRKARGRELAGLEAPTPPPHAHRVVICARGRDPRRPLERRTCNV